MRKLVLVLALIACVLAVAPAARAAKPVRTVRDPIAGSYIVRLASGSPGAQAARLTRRHGGRIAAVYGAAFRGYAVKMSARQARSLAQDPGVAWVEQDGLASIDTTQTGATWGIDRVDQRALPLSSTYSYEQNGAGVTAYVLDTGIRTSHGEFGGRAGVGYDAIGDGQNGQDCQGHGTHVAGTIGGTTYGVAKQVSLVAVRVLNCSGSGTWSQVIAGINWVAANHVSPAVANMSLGGGASTSVDDAVTNAVASGVSFAVAAGNEKTNACTRSPARAAAALTVGATTSSDSRASYSNYGTCLDLFGPGSSITSASYSSDTATTIKSGTSMATPHVAGAAALLLDADPAATPSTVSSRLLAATTTGVVSSAGTGSPNKLLYTGTVTTTPEPDPTEPPAAFTLSARGYKVRGIQRVDLTWSGATGGQVEIYRDNGLLITTNNDGTHTDAINRKGSGVYVYRVCEAGTTTCSNDARVVF